MTCSDHTTVTMKATINLLLLLGFVVVVHSRPGTWQGFNQELSSPDSTDNTNIFYHHGNATAWASWPNSSPNATSNCIPPPAYPIDVRGSAWTVVNGQITICGGSPYTSSCFSLNRDINLWLEFPELPQPRAFPVSIMVNRGWWITGGYTGSEFISSTVIFDAASNAWLPGPELPTANHAHCLVNINDDLSFMAGGSYGKILNDAWIYSWQWNTWTQMPHMSVARLGMACAMHTDEKNGDHVIMAGGFSTEFTTLVESFDIASKSWSILPDLPSIAHGASMIQKGQDLILVNAHNGNVMQFNDGNSTFAIISGTTTPVNGYYATVLPIDDLVLSGC